VNGPFKIMLPWVEMAWLLHTHSSALELAALVGYDCGHGGSLPHREFRTQ
jgi:hypothetical protein